MIGKVTNVNEHLVATELTVAAVTGATSITVADVEALDWDGGQVIIALNDLAYYSVQAAEDPAFDEVDSDDVADEDEGVLNLFTTAARTTPYTLDHDHEEGTQVAQYPIVHERTAYVLMEDQEEEIAARVPHSLYDDLDTGTREPTEGAETVELQLYGDEWVVVDVHGVEDEGTAFGALRGVLGGGEVGQFLIAAPGETSGFSWESAPAGVFTAIGCFSSYRNAALSLADGAVVTFDAEEWDVSSWHDIATGRFTPQVAGYYRLSACVRAGGALTTTGKFWVASIYKNGAQKRLGPLAGFQTVTAPQAIVTGLVVANGTTDYFEVVLNHNETGSIALTTGPTQTYFQGELIGVA